MSNAQKLPVVFEASDYTATLSVVIAGTSTPFAIPGTIQVDFYRFAETAPFISSTLANGRLASVNASGGQIVFDIPAGDLASIGPALGTVTVRRIDIPQVLFSYNARFADANEALTADFSTNFILRMNDVTLNVSPSSIEVYADHVHPSATTSAAGFMSAADKTIVDGVTAGLAGKIASSEKGAANGVTPLGADIKVPSAYLPSYVDDVEEYANLAGFPGSGSAGKIYTALDTGKIYRWSGSIYIEISASPGSTDVVPEGATNQYFTDGRAITAVQSLLDAKAGLATANTLTGDNTFTGDVQNNRTTAVTNSPVALGTEVMQTSGTAAPYFGIRNQKYLENSAGVLAFAASLDYVWTDPTSGSEDSRIDFLTMDAGTPIAPLTLGKGLVSAGATGGDMGVGSINTQALFVNGVDVLAAKLDDSQASAFGLSLLDDADAATARSTLGAAAASHTHAQSDVTNLVTDLSAKAPLASPSLTGTPTAPTPTGGDNTTKIATTAFVTNAVAASTTGVSQFNGRTGAVALTHGDVLDAAAVGDRLEIHRDGTGDRVAYLDFHSSGTPGANDFSARLIRGAGVNGEMLFDQTGTGNIGISGGTKLVRTGAAEVTGAFDVGGLATVNQLKFTRAINLPASTDLNTITVGGFYDVAPDPVNAPHTGFGWCYLEVQGHSTPASLYYMQRLTRLTGGKGDCVWGRVCLGGTWAAWKPLSGFATPEHFGGNGSTTTGASTNNSVALQRWLDSDMPLLLDQFYSVDATALSGVMTGKAGFQISGRGGRSGIILGGGSSIAISGLDQDNPTGFNANLVTLRDLNIITNQDSSAIPLSISFVDGDSGSQLPGANLDNVHVIASSTSNGSSVAQIYLYNVRQSQLTNVSVAGKYNAYAGSGIEFASGAGSAPVEVTLNNCRAAHVFRGFYLPTESGATANDGKQGHHFTNCVALAVDRGFDIAAGSEGFPEWFTFERCHAYFREAGILAASAGNLHASNCYFLGHGALTTAQGLAVSGSSILNLMQFNSNVIDFAACTATNRYGLNTPAGWVGRISSNRTRNATNAYGLIGSGPTVNDNLTF